jgi:hypothetical protein
MPLISQDNLGFCMDAGPEKMRAGKDAGRNIYGTEKLQARRGLFWRLA